uniref:Uncharacterized protein n=1 Tax=Rhizophora mucronata TaxID=61149 RepID=A0A2P2PFW8_RHIMU
MTSKHILSLSEICLHGTSKPDFFVLIPVHYS